MSDPRDLTASALPTVVDAGVVVGWFVREGDGGPRGAAHALTLLEMCVNRRVRLHAPELILAEAPNVLWKLVRFRDFPASGATRAVRALRDAPLAIAPLRDLVEPAFALAARLRCTVYDALYVALAERLAAPLVTTDRRLVERMDGVVPGVTLLETLF